MHLIASVCPLPNDVRPPRSENILGTQKRTATRDLSMSNMIFLIFNILLCLYSENCPGKLGRNTLLNRQTLFIIV